jgi:hypothetical protein
LQEKYKIWIARGFNCLLIFHITYFYKLNNRNQQKTSSWLSVSASQILFGDCVIWRGLVAFFELFIGKK